MLINLTKEELKKCQRLLDVKESNISAAEIYIEYLNFHYNDIKKIDIDNLTKKYSKSEAFFKAFLNKMEIDENDKEFSEIDKINKVSQFDLLDSNEYKNNDYYKAIGQIKCKEKDWQFVTLKYQPYEAFTYDELIIDDEYFVEHTPFGYFENDFPYLAVLQGEKIWMSVIPHEINTMKDAIYNAHGRVLVLGLGLGYYLYNIASKKEVTFIDVIEFDPAIIDLFNKYLLNKMPHYEKINIKLADAFEYLKKPNKYDYVFVDIYHNVGDGESAYLKCKSLEKFHSNTKFDYWIEKSILAMLRRQTLTVFEENLNGYKDIDYQKAENLNDEIINSIYKQTKNIKINSYKDLHDLLTDSSLKKLATKLF